MHRFATLLLALFLAALTAVPVRAQTAGDCELGTASADLNLSDVRARLFNKGSLFFDGGDPHYAVPQASGVGAIFAAGVWLGGMVNGELRTAAATYAQGGESFELFPGPLDPGAVLPEADCRRLNANGREAWDRIYVVSTEDVDRYEQTGQATPSLADWPVGLGAPAVDAGGNPVVPTSRDQLLDLGAGERPVLYGSETAFWVMNDVGGEHATTLSPPMGIEVQVSAFGVADATVPALFRGTFYRYRVINRSPNAIEAARFTLWTDPDLGNYVDDYIGSDSTRGMGFVYNSDNNDDLGSGGYGTPPPALGFDFLNGAGGSMHYFDGSPRTGEPDTAEDFYHYMRSLWKDGTPLTEGDSGADPDGTPIAYVYPGDPVAPAYWSEICPEPACTTPIPPSDRRMLISSPAFTLAPGASRDFDLALIFAQGDDHIDSVTELRAASDLVQARYDGGTLFQTIPPNQPLAPSAAPALLAPEAGAVYTDGEDVTFSWTAVSGADHYILEVSATSGFEAPSTYVITSETSATLSANGFPVNNPERSYWRVRAGNAGGRGPASETRPFYYYRFEGDFLAGGDGIIEVAYPGVPDVCAGAPADPGCQEHGGNTVWLDPNTNADYLITSPGQELIGSNGLTLDIRATNGDDFEIRFTEACATFGACLGFYDLTTDRITSVPFELWNTGREEGPEDDVRMIPIILGEPASAPPADDWADYFTGTQMIDVDGDGTEEEVPVSQRIYWYMPDRPEGYALFEAAANDFGGPGALYDRANDGDDQIDLNPATGLPCTNQGGYIDYCYRGAGFNVAPLWKMLFADLADDGTTPPAGTVVRVRTTKPALVANEPSAPEGPGAYALLPVYPNPLRGRATVPFAVEAPGTVRVRVYDLLGREVAVLVDGPVAAGRHEVAFDGSRLATGVYVVTLEAEGALQGRRKLLVLR